MKSSPVQWQPSATSIAVDVSATCAMYILKLYLVCCTPSTCAAKHCAVACTPGNLSALPNNVLYGVMSDLVLVLINMLGPATGLRWCERCTIGRGIVFDWALQRSYPSQR